MQRLLVLAVPAVVTATKCGPGHKHKTDLVNLFCSTSATDAASCDTACCGYDTDTCGGFFPYAKSKGDTYTCPFGTYADMDDAWKKTKTTGGKLYLAGKKTDASKQAVKDCCKPVVTCDNTLYSCPAGYKKSTNHKTKCPAGPKSCASTVGACCILDSLTCGGYQGAKTVGAEEACPATPTNAFAPVKPFTSMDNAWRKVKLTKSDKATFQATCCTALPTCAALTCPAGYKKSTANKAKPIDGTNVQVTKAGTSNEGETDKAAAAITKAKACCEKETGATSTKTTCGVLTVSCPAGEYYPKTAYAHILANTGNMANKCCAPVATCAAVTCPAGYKAKANVKTHSCSGDHTTCKTTCCEVDKTTCGGLAASITCAYGTYDESATWVLSGDSKTSQAVMDAWNSRPATAATKNTACCTAAAACKFEPLGTTTPAAVAAVTTTPASVV